MSDTSSTSGGLSDAQKLRIEQNKQKAIQLKKARLTSHPYAAVSQSSQIGKSHSSKPSKVVDSGGGFLLEEEEVEPDKLLEDLPGAFLDGDLLLCDECLKPFTESFLYSKFELSVCDGCRDKDDKHKLISKSDAMNVYLLNDSHLSTREPILKYIVRKNPHNPRWGDMKLFLECQVAERSLEIWETEEKLEEERERRLENHEKLKQKKYDKKVKELRKAVRSSLIKVDSGSHEHKYGEETCINEEDDEYSKTCIECGHTITYEKM